MSPTRYQRAYIGGEWRPVKGPSREVVNPADETVLAVAVDAEPEDADSAVRSALQAFPQWRSRPIAERTAYLRKIADEIEARSEEFLRILVEDVGTPRAYARFWQLETAINVFRTTADAADGRPEFEQIGSSRVTWDPIGVAVLISPWNYPLFQSALKIAPALAAGCTVVLKPSEVAPLALYMLTEIIDMLALPAGVFNLVPGAGETVGEALVDHPEVGIVSFTGSTRAGRRIAEVAGKNLTPVSLELGGKGASIVLSGADVRAAVAHAVGQCYSNAGQTCAAMTRLVVERELVPDVERIATELVTQLRIGDPQSMDTKLGPVVSRRQFAQVMNYIDLGISEGARALVDGTAQEIPPRGYFVRPTVFTDVSSDMTIAQEEIFGPVLSIIGVDGEEEAIEVAESTRYGLTGAVWAGDNDHAMHVARRLTTGSVTVNGGRLDSRAPFGGRKDSGFGRERGRFGLEEFFVTKTYHVDS